MRTLRTLGLLTLALPFALAFGLAGCGKKGDGDKGGKGGDKVFEVPELGVKITAPSEWSVRKQGDRWAIRSGMTGVILGKAMGPAPKDAEEAASRFADSKIHEKATLPSGAHYVHYSMRFPTGMGKPPVWLKFVYVILPTKAGAVTCQIQLQADDQKALYEKVCKSLAPTDGAKNAAK